VVHEGIDRLNRVMEETIQEVRSGVPALRSSIAAIESRLLAAQKIIASARKYSLSPSLSKKGVAQLEAYFNVAYPEIEKSQLTDTSLKSRTVDVNIQTLDELRTILRARTAEKGGMARLAESLGVQQARVSEWLSGKKEPGGKTTLRLLQWVEQQERQPNAPDSVTSTAKGKTQVRKSPNEKQTQVRKKG
jgi:DNA-binding transcriptional regulator YiaG